MLFLFLLLDECIRDVFVGVDELFLKFGLAGVDRCTLIWRSKNNIFNELNFS